MRTKISKTTLKRVVSAGIVMALLPMASAAQAQEKLYNTFCYWTSNDTMTTGVASQAIFTQLFFGNTSGAEYTVASDLKKITGNKGWRSEAVCSYHYDRAEAEQNFQSVITNFRKSGSNVSVYDYFPKRFTKVAVTGMTEKVVPLPTPTPAPTTAAVAKPAAKSTTPGRKSPVKTSCGGRGQRNCKARQE